MGIVDLAMYFLADMSAMARSPDCLRRTDIFEPEYLKTVVSLIILAETGSRLAREIELPEAIRVPEGDFIENPSMTLMSVSLAMIGFSWMERKVRMLSVSVLMMRSSEGSASARERI